MNKVICDKAKSGECDAKKCPHYEEHNRYSKSCDDEICQGEKVSCIPVEVIDYVIITSANHNWYKVREIHKVLSIGETVYWVSETKGIIKAHCKPFKKKCSDCKHSSFYHESGLCYSRISGCVDRDKWELADKQKIVNETIERNCDNCAQHYKAGECEPTIGEVCNLNSNYWKWKPIFKPYKITLNIDSQSQEDFFLQSIIYRVWKEKVDLQLENK
jgi:hypothetical protein